jgi:hypothetical protein
MSATLAAVASVFIERKPIPTKLCRERHSAARSSTMLSEKRCRLYEAAGWERIKLELEVGDFHFVPVDTFARQEAREWVEAKEREDRTALEAKFQLEQSRFAELRRWMIIASVAAIVAAITGLIAVFK